MSEEENGENVLTTWLKTAEAPAVAMVNMEDSQAFFRLVVKAEVPSTTVFADRKVASDVAFVANDEFLPQPRISIVKNLKAELGNLLTGMDGPLTVLPFALLRDLASTRARRVSQDMEIIAGYPVPAEIVLHCALQELRTTIAAIARRGRRPVVIQDSSGLFEGIAGDSIAWFDSAGAERERPAQDEAPLSALIGEGEPVEVAPGAVLSHANFLADTDPATLRRMAPLLIEPAFAPLIDFWRDRLTGLSSVDFAEWLRERALRHLEEAFTPADAARKR